MKLEMLPHPVIWRDAAGMIDAMVQGDASAAETIARGDAAEPFHRAFEQNTALVCAAWPTRSADRYTGPWNAATPNPIPSDHVPFDPGFGQGPAAR